MENSAPDTQPSVLKRLLGQGTAPASHLEKWLSAAGGFVAIGLILLISRSVLGLQGAALLVASMGASAVLIFAVPHGPLSQPWPVAGGHLVSAIIGVSCAKWIPHPLLAPAIAVGFAIGAMYYLRCIHPPGGATALTAAVGGPAIVDLGYQFVATPVLLNVVTILLVGIAFNYGFPSRRYPRTLIAAKAKASESQPVEKCWIAHSDLVYALSEIDSFIDVSETDLLRIYDLALTHQANRAGFKPDEILLGQYYSNGRFGEDWEVRQIMDQAAANGLPDEGIIYRVVVGPGRRSTAATTRGEFARWARHRVVRDENSWKKMDQPEQSR
ncbi:MAG: HPP family protein [Chromatiales bacterium]|nr:HPP family protein [Chromatiales bacterium]